MRLIKLKLKIYLKVDLVAGLLALRKNRSDRAIQVLSLLSNYFISDPENHHVPRMARNLKVNQRAVQNHESELGEYQFGLIEVVLRRGPPEGLAPAPHPSPRATEGGRAGPGVDPPTSELGGVPDAGPPQAPAAARGTDGEDETGAVSHGIADGGGAAVQVDVGNGRWYFALHVLFNS